MTGLSTATAAPDILFADAHLLVAVKPAGLLAVPGRGEDKQDCLSRRVQHAHPGALIVHRLDMATSGLMLMALDPAAQRALSLAFEQREVYKRYEAVVHGRPAPAAPADAEGWRLIDLPIAVDWPRRPLRVIDPATGKPSQTRWRLANTDTDTDTDTDTAPQRSRLLLEPVTGRSHQLRVHLQALGHPILGDALYAPPEVQALSPRLLLHACVLGFRHPATGEQMRFDSAAPF